MIPVYVTVVAILGSNALGQGVIECSFSGSSETRQCFGAVGQPLIFHLPNTENVEIRLTKDAKHRILKAISERLMYLNEDFLRQTGNIYNRTITFGNAMKKHSGDYLLQEFTAEGKNLKNVNLHLKIHAPVSVPAVSQTCLSPEKMTVTCSSEGDAVEFIFTLDNQLLLQTRNHNQSLSNSTAEEPSVSRISIDLHGQLTGNFMCQVRNNVSEHETVLNLTACKEPVSDPNVSQTCLSPEQMNISCSAEGDGVKFTLSLDDNELMQTREGSTGKLNVSNVSFILHGQLVGKLVCRVQNDVSSEQTSIQLTSCNDASCTLIPVAVAVVAGLVSLLVVSAIFLGIKHFKRRTNQPRSVKEGNAGDENVYSDVIYFKAKD
ncbi:uncharacterized protein LOC133460204 [Cololabis saira]|uniref:uncharacterized protein LOC133460204 n=1 Tax=Cololabis saira TaxID=129043 RepID=UPI002AD57C88|nr:uncharacterized protein LOC133460204 [Cololabis saira]